MLNVQLSDYSITGGTTPYGPSKSSSVYFKVYMAYCGNILEDSN